MLQYLGIASLFIALGAALDRVVTDDAKCEFRKRRSLGTSDRQGRFESVSDLVFNLFLSRHLTWKTFLAVSALSLLVFLAIACLQLAGGEWRLLDMQQMALNGRLLR